MYKLYNNPIIMDNMNCILPWASHGDGWHQGGAPPDFWSSA